MSSLADLNKAMYDVLMGGMTLSTATYIAGIALFLTQNPSPLQASIIHYQTATQFAAALSTLQSAAVLTLATVFLVATPIARVLVSIFVFALNRNTKYVAVTTIVFLILLLSIMLGYFWHFTPQ
jgi:uncharacterized membrane protein